MQPAKQTRVGQGSRLGWRPAPEASLRRAAGQGTHARMRSSTPGPAQPIHVSSCQCIANRSKTVTPAYWKLIAAQLPDSLNPQAAWENDLELMFT